MNGNTEVNLNNIEEIVRKAVGESLKKQTESSNAQTPSNNSSPGSLLTKFINDNLKFNKIADKNAPTL